MESFVVVVRNFFTLLSLLLFVGTSNAQMRVPDHLSFDGLTYGYHNNPRRKMLQKEEIELEGVLHGVKIEIKQEKNKKVEWAGESGNLGQFDGVIPLGKIYKVEFSRDGYAPGSFTLNLKNIPEDYAAGGLVFVGMELILNSYIDGKALDPSKDFGKLYFDGTSEAFEFTAYKRDKKNVFVKNDQAGTPAKLMRGSVASNMGNNTLEAIADDAPIVDPTDHGHHPRSAGRTVVTVDGDTIIKPAGEGLLTNSDFDIKSFSVLDDISAEGIADRESAIAKAREQLERDKLLATTPEELAIIEAREQLILAAEKDLDKAKEIIALQDEQISSQQSIIYLFVFLAVLLLGFLGYAYWSYRQKSKQAKIIAEKNHQISESINYASRIQQSILLPAKEIERIFPESFVLYQPRDIVSGDFYWFAEIDGKKIVAAVDCTGHGVPGAFMSMIGNTLMNQVIREKGTTDAASVLNQLHDEIVKALRQEPKNPKSNQDGMDMAMCIIDEKKKEIDFAGAMNPLYMIQNGSIEIIQPNKLGIGGTIVSRKMKKLGGYKSEKVKYESGASIYMFSDGYMDQFGGDTGEKFNTDRFDSMLLGMKESPMKDQGQKAETEIKRWMGDHRQIDDILLIGVRL